MLSHTTEVVFFGLLVVSASGTVSCCSIAFWLWLIVTTEYFHHHRKSCWSASLKAHKQDKLQPIVQLEQRCPMEHCLVMERLYIYVV